MARTYRFVTPEQRTAVSAEVARRNNPTAPVITDDLAAAWEREHYTHSVLKAATEDIDQKQVHQDAMDAIEAALTKAGK